jgi:SAM-dependent methyltransferase
MTRERRTSGADESGAAPAYFGTWDLDQLTTGQLFCRDIHDRTRGVVSGATLDLGCGTRVYYDTSQVTRWVGLDVAASALGRVDFLGERPKSATTVEGSCDRLGFVDASFDTVCAMFLLHHLGRRGREDSRRRVLRVLREARRVLRPGGRLVVAENAAQPLEALYHALYPLAYPLARTVAGTELPYFWTVRQLRAMATAAGFSRVSVERIVVREAIYAPVLRFRVPARLSELLAHMVLCTLET